MSTHTAAVIGAGFAGMAAAASLAQQGLNVHLFEKHDQPGGRARQFEAEGFTFDMGPSWYWMPDVFDEFFNRFGKSVSDYYELKRLDPSYQVIFDTAKRDVLELPASMNRLYQVFENIEPGSAEKLKRFLAEAEYKYTVGMSDFVHKPGHSIMDFADLRVLKSLFKLQMFSSVTKAVHTQFKDERLRQILEFPVLFLGATPEDTPALYTLMNYADMCLGTWYPMGGMHQIALAMENLCKELGVTFHYNSEATAIHTTANKATGIELADGSVFKIDSLIGAADYHHVEQRLLPVKQRRYNETYWQKRKMAPSSLLFYLGVKGRISKLHHHNLFFDTSFSKHAHEIYKQPSWPSEPLFYVCCPSKTDNRVAPQGDENLFLLIPTAPGLADQDESRRQFYYEVLMDRLEEFCGEEIRSRVVYNRSYAQTNFVEDYHAYKGNAYGLANTLLQTAFLKPKMASKLKNMFFAGQLTTPGPGVPPSLISGQVAAKEVMRLIDS